MSSINKETIEYVRKNKRKFIKIKPTKTDRVTRIIEDGKNLLKWIEDKRE